MTDKQVTQPEEVRQPEVQPEPEPTPQPETTEPVNEEVNEDVLELLGKFTGNSINRQDEEILMNNPEYQEFLKWKQQQQLQQQPQPQPSQVDYAKILQNPQEFGNFINNFSNTIQQNLINIANRVLESAEILYHLKSLEDKYPQISENPQALQVAIMKARQISSNPREVAENAVSLYMKAYNIKQNIIKSKGVKDMNEKVQINTATQSRLEDTKKNDDILERILRAYKNE